MDKKAVRMIKWPQQKPQPKRTAAGTCARTQERRKMSEIHRECEPEETNPDQETAEFLIDTEDFYDLLMEQQEQM